MATASTSRLQQTPVASSTPGLLDLLFASAKQGNNVSDSSSPQRPNAAKSKTKQQEQPEIVSAFLDEQVKLMPGITAASKQQQQHPQGSKKTRRGGKGRRRKDPSESNTSEDEAAKQSDQLSQSAPTQSFMRPPPQAKDNNHGKNDWDMPANGTRKQDGQALTWQQQLLQSQPTNDTATKRTNSTKRSSNKPPAQSQQRAAGQQPSSTPRDAPLDSGNQSDSGLTWQQEQLRSQANQSSPVKSTRKQLLKDEETFGMSALNLGVKEHVPVKSKSTSNLTKMQPASNKQQKKQPTTGASTPTKIESRYAGPTFHNSPAPSSLPTPSFMLRRQAPEVQS